MIKRLSAGLAAIALLAACVPQARIDSHEAVPALKIASWNLEFLAESNGTGCEPREPADYAAMRHIVDTLDADVIAFQEAENTTAAARVFDPVKYQIVMEVRPGAVSGTCGGKNPTQPFIRQAVGLAIKKGIAFERNPDVTSLMLGNPQLRSGIDIVVRAKGHLPIRLLGVHLKSGCPSGADGKACPVLLNQIPAVEAWIDAAASGPTRFAVLGDWNRRLAQQGDQFWSAINDQDPANAELRLADAGVTSACNPRFNSFIDHVVLDRRAGGDLAGFSEALYATNEKHYSDHCPIMITLSR